MINKASYDRKQQTLFITVDDETFSYFNVPMFIFNQLAKSSSKEEYFDANIKNKYPHDKST